MIVIVEDLIVRRDALPAPDPSCPGPNLTRPGPNLTRPGRRRATRAACPADVFLSCLSLESAGALGGRQEAPPPESLEDRVTGGECVC